MKDWIYFYIEHSIKYGEPFYKEAGWSIGLKNSYDIDFDNKQWKFTPKKTANSLFIDLIVPLFDQVFQYFKELYTINGNQEFCFASNSSAGIT